MSITDSDLASIQAIFKPLLGKKPWKVWIGIGSFAIFEFGDPIITDGGYTHGDWNLWVEQAMWRLEKGRKVLAASEDSRDELAQAVKHMENVTLLSIEITRPALQTKITFEGGIAMHLFPIYTDEEHDHWRLFTPERKVLVIGPGNTWSYHNSNEPRPAWNAPKTNNDPPSE